MQREHKNCPAEIKRLNEAVRDKEEEIKKLFVTGTVSIPGKDGSSTVTK